MKKIVLLALIAISPVVAMQKQQQLAHVLAFHNTAVKSRESLGNLQLLQHEDNFYVAKDGLVKLVNKYDIDAFLKNANPAQLQKYLEQDGYIQVDQLENQDYVLKAKGRIRGGGPILASLFYGATKAVCYGTFIAGAGAAVGATGGGAIVVAAAGEMAAVTGSGVVAVAIGSSATATAAASSATAAGVAIATSAGGLSAIVTGIEALSVLAGAAGAAIPFL